MTVLNTGVKARYGNVRDNEVSRIAFEYSSIASTSIGTSAANQTQNPGASCGHGCNNSSGNSIRPGIPKRTIVSSRAR